MSSLMIKNWINLDILWQKAELRLARQAGSFGSCPEVYLATLGVQANVFW